MDKFFLSTNDSQIATNFSYLLDGKAEVHIFPTNCLTQLNTYIQKDFPYYSHFVLGINKLNEEAIEIFKKIKEVKIEKLLLVKHLTSDNDIRIANEYGVSKVLIDPLEKVKYAMENSGNILDYLSHNRSGEECHHYNAEELYVIEKNLYYNKSELWVGNFADKIYLSHLENNLLELFIENEGRVILGAFIADEIWKGQIEESSIRKLVRRLRNKLGNPTLIQGRKQGGYIFKKKDANIQ